MTEPFDAASLGQWWQDVFAASSERGQAIHDAFQRLDNAGVVSKVKVATYICRRGGCVLATVIRLGDQVLARTRDYKLSDRTNRQRSVPAARRASTLDGNRHWPGDTFLVNDLADEAGVASIDMNCTHYLRSTRANDIMSEAQTRTPGRPGAPIRI